MSVLETKHSRQPLAAETYSAVSARKGGILGQSGTSKGGSEDSKGLHVESRWWDLVKRKMIG